MNVRVNRPFLGSRTVRGSWGQTVKGPESHAKRVRKMLHGMLLKAQKQGYDNSIYFISIGGLGRGHSFALKRRGLGWLS